MLKVYFAGKIFVIEDEAYYHFWAEHLSWGYPEHPPMVAWIIAASKDFFPDVGFFRFWDIRFPGILFSVIIFFLAYDWGKRLESSNPQTSFYLPKLFSLSSTGILFATFMTGIPYYFGSFFLITPDTPLVFFFFLTLYFYYRGVFENPFFFYGGGICLGLGMLSKLNIALPALGLAVFFLTSPLSRKYFHPIHLRNRKTLYYLGHLSASLVLAFGIFLPYLLWNIKNDFPVLNNLGRLMYQNTDVFSFLRFWGEQSLLYFPLLLPLLVALPFTTILDTLKKQKINKALVSIAHQKKYFLAWVSAIPLLYFFYKSTQANLRINWLGGTLLGSTALLSLWVSEIIRKWGRTWGQPFTAVLTLITLSLGLVFYIAGNKFTPLKPVEEEILQVYPKYRIFRDSYLVYNFFDTKLVEYYQNNMIKDLPIVSPNYQLPSLINYYVHPKLEAFGEASRIDYHLMTFYFLNVNYTQKLHKPYYLFVSKDQIPDQEVFQWHNYSLSLHKLDTFHTAEPNQGRSYDLYIVK